jgi:hypothetical protein
MDYTQIEEIFKKAKHISFMPSFRFDGLKPTPTVITIIYENDSFIEAANMYKYLSTEFIDFNNSFHIQRASDDKVNVILVVDNPNSTFFIANDLKCRKNNLDEFLKNTKDGTPALLKIDSVFNVTIEVVNAKSEANTYQPMQIHSVKITSLGASSGE